MKPMKTAFIGTGAISHSHIAAMNALDSYTPVACWNRIEDEPMGTNFAQEHSLNYYDNIVDMIESEAPDIVINTLPPSVHHLGMEEAAKRGAHLVIEKPMALNIKTCAQLIETAKRHAVMLAVSESSRFNRLYNTYETHREKFGDILHMMATNYRMYFSKERSPWIFDPNTCNGGMILNVGVHRIAMMRLFAASYEVSVNAKINNNAPEIQVPGDCSIQINYDNGCAGTLLMCGYHANPYSNLNRIVTQKGHVILDDNQINFSDTQGKQQVYELESNLSDKPYENFYSSLSHALVNNLSSPYTGEEGMRDVAVIKAALLSSKENRTVMIDEVLKQ